MVGCEEALGENLLVLIKYLNVRNVGLELEHPSVNLLLEALQLKLNLHLSSFSTAHSEIIVILGHSTHK